MPQQCIPSSSGECFSERNWCGSLVFQLVRWELRVYSAFLKELRNGEAKEVFATGL